MPWMQGYPYYLVMGSVLSLYMGIGSYKHRHTPGRCYLWILMLLVSFIFAATAGEILSGTFQAKLWWKNLQQGPLFLSTIFTYAVIKEYVSRSSEGLGRRLIFFCIPVALDVVLIFTDSYHHLMRSEAWLSTVAGVTGIAVEPTVLSMILIAYDQLFGLYAVYLLAISLLNSPKHYFRRNLLLLVGLLIPVLSVALLPLLKITITGFTAFTYLPPIVAAYLILFRDPRLSLYPLAKNKIFENMKDGIVLTDRYDRIIDVNEAAGVMLSELVDKQTDTWMGKSIHLLLARYGQLSAHYTRRTEGQFEIEPPGKDGACFGIALIATERSGAENTGMLLVFSDHSEKKRYERELLHQATVDDLTGLYNRRHFMRLVQNYSVQAGAGMALLLFDIDDFKLINDTYGHMAGDQALVDLSCKILQVYQDNGVAGRVGGEEFAVCFFTGSEAAALQEAESFRATMGEHTVLLDGGHRIRLTVSIGIAFTERSDVTFEDLYREADEALYLSKATGKNRVTLGRQPVVRQAVKS
ncbi:diguanylate cyclase [Paenibacillus sp. MMS20-IR301]|uniref:histidine kinase N-terminal 7TM domain-containing diguanylate cyclase n=1 Tax=Paenibacillus sp. MMS20-IR301 TaxID=2895946 RepID=UPI0028ED86FC|nr:diguanylate cyclase [Paenibacillus sp. MMS20-IR301]WNS42455.1 diguanylate cyclase [Paenibacillus sp. MMS20-IR301]